MATEEQLKLITAHLKLPDSIRDLPIYRGSKSGLHDFIANVDEIMSACARVLGENVVPTAYLRAIRNKIQGEADDILSMYNTPLNWETIKNNLKNHYSDKRNETSLIKDLHSLYQGGSSIEEFFSKVIELQSSLIVHVKIHDSEDVRKAKEELYATMCLNAFLAGIKEPLGSMIRARNPNNLPEAYNLCIMEQNMFYIKHKQIFVKQAYDKQLSHRKPPLIPSRNLQLNPQLFQNQFNRSYPNPPKAPIYYNHQPFKPNPNNRPQFRDNSRQPFRNPAILPPRPQKLEAMDTSSIQDQYKQYTAGLNRPQYLNQNRNQYNLQQIGQPKVQVEELYNIEEMNPSSEKEYQYSDGMIEYDHQYSDHASLTYPYDPDPSEVPLPEEIDDQDFRQNASEAPLGS